MPATDPVLGVLKNFVQRLNQGDVRGSLEFLAVDATLSDPGGTIHGQEQILQHWQGFLPMKFSFAELDGQRVLACWHPDRSGAWAVACIVPCEVQGGRIARMEFRVDAETKRRAKVEPLR